MKKPIFFLLCVTLVLVSCDTKDENSEPENSDMTITVYNVEEWSVTSPQPVCSGAFVELKSATHTLTATTNDEGEAVFENFEANRYTIEITKDDMSNLIDKDISGRGFVAIGIFQNHAEIDDYTNIFGDLMQPGAVPGDIKIFDSNWDYIIDERDKVLSTEYIPYVDVNADFIVNEDDMVNGAYVIKDNLDMDTYIGR
jgi:hypothetical protein